MNSRIRVDLYALLALAFTFFAWVSLLSPFYFMNAHDAHHSLFFPLEFDKGIRDGFWLPRWGADFAHGYGYPMFVFYAPLSFYIWEAVYATGFFGVVASTKATFIIGFLVAAAGMYTYARDLWGRRAGLLASVVYTYLPYHLVNIYVRAALAEFMAMALLPWIALAFRALVRRPSLRAVAIAAASYGTLLWTHNITALLFTPLLGALILFEMALRWRGERLSPVALLRVQVPSMTLAVVLGVLLGTAIWLPGLTEQGAIKIEQWALQTYQYSDHFVYLAQLFSPAWGFGYSVPGAQDGMPFQLGTPALLLALVGLAVLWRYRAALEHLPAVPPRRFVTNLPLYLFYAISLLILVALMLPPAIVIWDLSPLSTLIQFPWRLLGVSGFVLSLLASSAVALLPSAPASRFAPGLLVLLLLVLIPNSAYTQPQTTPPNPRDETQQTWRDYERKYPDMVAMVAQTQVQPTDSTMLAALEANETPQRFEALSEGVVIEQQHVGGGSASARIEAAQPATIRYLTYWYPGWTATLNGAPLPIQQDNSPLGLITVAVPAGSHTLSLRFEDTPRRALANGVSLAALITISALLLLGTWRTARALPAVASASARFVEKRNHYGI